MKQMRSEMDEEIPVLTGYLNVPTQSGFPLNRISKKKSCQRYCLLFKSSRHGIERLEICESKEDKNPKIITLENCVKITQEHPPANLIHIVKKTGALTLNTLNDDDLKEWVNALQTVAFRDKSGAHGFHAAIEEDNDLYCSSFGDGLFIITLIPSDTSMRCNIEPRTYMLHLTATELQLKSAEDINVVIAKWPYRFIRKYGYRDGKFTFEAGRKCTTGEGVFTLDHTNPQEVFRCMSAKMKSMKKMISGVDSLGNAMETGENQLSVAASMEAGSRSPLPPSPSNQNSTDFEMNSTQSCMSIRGFISSSDSLNNFSVTNLNCSTGSVVLPSTKHVPNKPPRKLPSPLDKLPSISLSPISQSNSIITNMEQFSSGQQGCDRLKKHQNYEPVTITTSTESNKNVGSTVILKPISPQAMKKCDEPPDLPVRNENTTKLRKDREYESIETITDAWKTLGVCDIKHTERNVDVLCNEDSSDFVRQRSITHQREKNSLKESLPSTKIPKLVDIDIGENANSGMSSMTTEVTYDRLDFLSPNNKTSSGYKTIVTVSTTPSNRTPPALNDYELIASPDIQACRKADDTYLGYGILRKSNPNLTKTLSQTILNSNNITSNNTASSPSQNLEFSGTATGKPTKSSVLTPDHRSYNGINYTMVSKPKRV